LAGRRLTREKLGVPRGMSVREFIEQNEKKKTKKTKPARKKSA